MQRFYGFDLKIKGGTKIIVKQFKLVLALYTNA